MAVNPTDFSKSKKGVTWNDDAVGSQDFAILDDTVIGSNYNDTLMAGAGNDRIAGGNGDDFMSGGAGNDSLWGDSLGNTNVGNDNGKDTLLGGIGEDLLHGGNAKDNLDGGADDDELYGENGSDVLKGGEGDDVLTGGNGPDTFVYGAITESDYTPGGPGALGAAWTASAGSSWTSPWDVITDFATGEDKIDLDGISLTDGPPILGTIPPANLIFRGAQGDDNDANTARANFDYAVWTDDAGNFLYADTTGDGKADLKIQVNGVTAGDLIGVEANDAPVFTSPTTGTIAENSAITTVAYDANATDQEGDTITYSLADGGDNDLFDINTTTGEVTFIGSPNFENPQDVGGNNIYNITVVASDGFIETEKEVAITVTDVNEAPVITSPNDGDPVTASVDENTTAVADVDADDPDAGQTLTYTLSGDDAALFSIDASTGVVTFTNAPDFETPLDAGADNVYDFTVTATDDGTGTLSDSQDFAINVTNVNEAPTVTPLATASTPENVLTTTAVYTVTATDPDAATTLTYSITGGADSALFNINTSNGAVTFKASPDFEVPGDAGGNNVYDIIVTASDGLLSDDQAVAITVTDLPEAPPPPVDGSGPTGIALSQFGQSGSSLQNLGTFVGTGDTPGDTYTWSINSDNPDIKIGAEGVLSANVGPGTYTFTVTATDPNAAANTTTSDTYTLLVGHTGNPGQGADTMPGGIYILSPTGNNIEVGEGGVDTLTGSGGIDYILGSGGNDIIKGLGGADILSGGTGGSDTFVFAAASDSLVGNGDNIHQFDGGLSGGHDTLDFQALGITAANVTVSNSDGNTIVQADTAGGDMEITLVGVTLLESQLAILY